MWETLIIITILSAGFSMIISVRNTRRLKVALGNLGERLGLTFSSKLGTFTISGLHGTIGNRKIEIELVREKNRPNGVSIEIHYHQPKLPFFNIQKQHFFDFLETPSGFRDIAIGDCEFDKTFRLSTKNPAFLTGLLNSKIRALMMSAHLAGEIEVISNTRVSVILNYSFHDTLADEAKHIVNTLMMLIDEICASTDYMDRLIGNIDHETETAIIINNIHMLVDSFPKNHKCKATLKKCLQSSNCAVALEAARYLRIEAFEKIIDFLLDSDRKIAVEAALLICHSDFKSRVDDLIGRLAKVESPELVLILVKGLGEWKAPALISLFLNWLKMDPSQIKIEIIKNLGHWGDINCLKAIHPYSQLGLKNAVLSQTALTAIDQIKARCSEHSDGMLSVISKSEEGQLSKTEAPGGNLSLSGSEEF